MWSRLAICWLCCFKEPIAAGFGYVMLLGARAALTASLELLLCISSENSTVLQLKHSTVTCRAPYPAYCLPGPRKPAAAGSVSCTFMLAGVPPFAPVAV